MGSCSLVWERIEISLNGDSSSSVSLTAQLIHHSGSIRPCVVRVLAFFPCQVFNTEQVSFSLGHLCFSLLRQHQIRTWLCQLLTNLKLRYIGCVLNLHISVTSALIRASASAQRWKLPEGSQYPFETYRKIDFLLLFSTCPRNTDAVLERLVDHFLLVAQK